MYIPSDVTELVNEIPMPVLYRVRQKREYPVVEDIQSEVARELRESNILSNIKSGDRIAITAGSRGIISLPEVIKAVVAEVKKAGGEPFIIPAMGSHGGATAEGQRQLLADLGVTESYVGAPIRATMEVVKVGEVPGGPAVYMDLYASQADGIILVNRVKPHTDFHGNVESGLAKMCVIGLGKQVGAETMHLYGANGFRKFLSQAAQISVRTKPIIGGVAIVESPSGKPAKIKALPPGDIGGPGEEELLKEAYDLLMRIPFRELDVLVVDYMGKNISGTGMDTNVIGRTMVHGEPEPHNPDISVIVALRLTEETHGNASGIGLADVTTQKLLEQIDFKVTYTNAITSGIFGMQRVQIPIVMPDDRSAISLAIQCCGRPDAEHVRLARIYSTLDLEEILISESLLTEAESNPDIEILGPEGPLSFQENGDITPWPGAVSQVHATGLEAGVDGIENL